MFDFKHGKTGKSLDVYSIISYRCNKTKILNPIYVLDRRFAYLGQLIIGGDSHRFSPRTFPNRFVGGIGENGRYVFPSFEAGFEEFKLQEIHYSSTNQTS